MKILISGFNKLQCTRLGYLTQQLKVVPSHYSLFNALFAMGHVVEQREVIIGESLAEYDRVIVFIAAPRQMVTTRLYQGLWAISQRPDCIIAVDDWQFVDLWKGVEKCLSKNELLAEFVLNTNKTTAPEVEKYIWHYQKALETIVAKKNKMLISAFDRGDTSIVSSSLNYPRDLICTYDPNPFHRNRKPGDYGDIGPEAPEFKGPIPQLDDIDYDNKQSAFNFISLVQSRTAKWLKDQKIKWPVNMIGSRALKQERYLESEVVEKIINTHWGTLLPEYKIAKLLWWRAKPLQCADVGSILIGGKDEMIGLYGETFGELRANDLELMSDRDLWDLASRQRYEFYKKHQPLDKEKQMKALEKVL